MSSLFRIYGCEISIKPKCLDLWRGAVASNEALGQVCRNSLILWYPRFRDARKGAFATLIPKLFNLLLI